MAVYFTIFHLKRNQHILAVSNDIALEGNTTKTFRAGRTGIKLILFYTKFFNGPWTDFPQVGSLSSPILNEKFSFEQCEFSKCELTYNKNLVSEASAVGFHAGDITASVPTVRKPHQIWFYYVLESPLNVKSDKKALNNKFNWTMSYRRDSEIHVPYGSYTLRTHNRKIYKSYAEGKSEFAVWMVSNCRSYERNEYVRSLRRYVPVTVYGRCGEKLCPKRSLACKQLLKKHKFYLAFENGNCLDYITEKYWENAIENEILPVVMGGADYSSLAIPGSYIDVTKFSSPQKLAEYLKYLDKNDTAYNEYFLWREKYEQTPTKIACTLCKQLHNSTLIGKTRVYNNLETFWGRNLCRKLNLKT